MESQYESEEEVVKGYSCKSEASRLEDALKEAMTSMDNKLPDDIKGTLQQDINAFVEEV